MLASAPSSLASLIVLILLIQVPKHLIQRPCHCLAPWVPRWKRSSHDPTFILVSTKSNHYPSGDPKQLCYLLFFKEWQLWQDPDGGREPPRIGCLSIISMISLVVQIRHLWPQRSNTVRTCLEHLQSLWHPGWRRDEDGKRSDLGSLPSRIQESIPSLHFASGFGRLNKYSSTLAVTWEA